MDESEKTSVGRVTLRLTALLLLAVLVLASGGCSSEDVAYMDSDAVYTLEEAQAAAESASKPQFAGESVLVAEELRQTQLAALRSREGDAAELAALLTELFPEDQRSVPYYIEAATVDGQPAWIVVEMWGVEGATLDHSRVWVLERETGRVMLSATFK